MLCIRNIDGKGVGSSAQPMIRSVPAAARRGTAPPATWDQSEDAGDHVSLTSRSCYE